MTIINTIINTIIIPRHVTWAKSCGWASFYGWGACRGPSSPGLVTASLVSPGRPSASLWAVLWRCSCGGGRSAGERLPSASRQYHFMYSSFCLHRPGFIPLPSSPHLHLPTLSSCLHQHLGARIPELLPLHSLPI